MNWFGFKKKPEGIYNYKPKPNQLALKDEATECFATGDESTYYSEDKRTINNSGSGTHTYYGSFTLDPNTQSICIWDIKINDPGTWISIGIKDIVSYKSNGKIDHFHSGYTYKSGDIVTMELNTATGFITFYKTFLSRKHYVHRINIKGRRLLSDEYQLCVTLSDEYTKSSVTIKDFNIINPQYKLKEEKEKQIRDYFEYIGLNIKAKNENTTITIKGKYQGTSYGHFVVNTIQNNDIYRWIIDCKNIKRCSYNSKQCEFGIGIAAAHSLSNLNSNICSDTNIARYMFAQNKTLYAAGKQSPSWLPIDGDTTIVLELDTNKNCLLCYDAARSVRARECKDITPGIYSLAVFLSNSSMSTREPSVTIQELRIIGDETKNTDTDATGINVIEKEQKQRHDDSANVEKKTDNDDLVSPLLNRIDLQNKEITELTQKSVNNDKEKSNLKTSVIAMKKENTQLKRQYELISSEIRKKHRTLEEKYNNSLKEHRGLNDALMMMEKEVAELRKENDQLMDDRKESEMTIDSLKNEIKILKIKSIDINSFMKWDSDDVLNWVLSIENGLFVTYGEKLKKQIAENEICGKDLITMNIEDVTYLGVTKFADKKLLMKRIQKLIEINENKHNKANQQIAYNENEGSGAQTPYV